MKNYSKYFPVSEDDKAWGIHTLDCGTSLIESGSEFPLPEHPQNYKLTWETGRILHEFQVIYLVDGKGVYENRFSGRINLEAGTIIMIYPEVWHRYKPAMDHIWHTYWVGFDGNLAHEFINKLDLTKEHPIKKIGYQEKIIQVYLDILETSQLEYTGYQQVFVGEIIKLIGLIHSIQRQSEFKQKNVDRIIQEAKIILMQKSINISMEKVADELNMGYSSFRKLFRNYTGISPAQYQMQYKINNAKSLLNEGKLTIKEIAAVLEFESPQYFSRIFRKKTGKSPREYRQQIFEPR